MSEFQEFKAKTVDEAITNAMITLESTAEHLDYQIVETGSKGFLGIGAKPAVIRARKIEVEDPELGEKKKHHHKKNKFDKKKQESFEKKRPEKPEIIKQEPAIEKDIPQEKAVKEIKQIDVTPYLEPAENFLKKVFEAMQMEVAVEVKAGEDINTVEVELKGDDMGMLIGKRGQTLDSLQYLTSIIINSGNEDYVRVKVDTENYRYRRKETLENLAKNISSKVKRTNKAVSLEPMNPYERRIIHSVLQKDKYVDTHSEGEEPYRKVVVTPNKNCKEYANKKKSFGNKRYHRNHSSEK